MKLLASVYRHVDILPHFLQHYVPKGVDRFLFAVNQNQNRDLLGEFWEVANKWPEVDIEIQHLMNEPYDVGDMLERLNWIRTRFVNPDEYFVTCDLDEFIEPPKSQSFQELAKDCLSKGYSKYAGTLIDRVAADGSLPAIKSEPHIRFQFPVGCNLTSAVLKGGVSKVQFQLGSHKISVSSAMNDHGGLLYPDRFNVHHYKWNANVLPRLEERVQLYKHSHSSWAMESQRFINHWKKHGKIDLKNPDLRVWNGPTT